MESSALETVYLLYMRPWWLSEYIRKSGVADPCIRESELYTIQYTYLLANSLTHFRSKAAAGEEKNGQEEKALASSGKIVPFVTGTHTLLKNIFRLFDDFNWK